MFRENIKDQMYFQFKYGENQNNTINRQFNFSQSVSLSYMVMKLILLLSLLPLLSKL